MCGGSPAFLEPTTLLAAPITTTPCHGSTPHCGRPFMMHRQGTPLAVQGLRLCGACESRPSRTADLGRSELCLKNRTAERVRAFSLHHFMVSFCWQHQTSWAGLSLLLLGPYLEKQCSAAAVKSSFLLSLSVVRVRTVVCCKSSLSTCDGAGVQDSGRGLYRV